MPPVILWALGAVGAAVVVKWLAHQGRRANAELDAVKAAKVGDAEAPRKLRRDPDSDVYRPD